MIFAFYGVQSPFFAKNIGVAAVKQHALRLYIAQKQLLNDEMRMKISENLRKIQVKIKKGK